MSSGFANISSPSVNGLVDISADIITTSQFTTEEFSAADIYCETVTATGDITADVYRGNDVDVEGTIDCTTLNVSVINADTLNMSELFIAGDVHCENIDASSGVGCVTLSCTTVNSDTINVTDVECSDIGCIGEISCDTFYVQNGATFASGLNANQIASGIVSNAEFEYLNGLTDNIQTQLGLKYSSSTTGINANQIATGIISNTEFEHLNGLSNNIQFQLTTLSTNKYDSSTVGMNANQIADGTVSNTEFQYLNSLTSNVQLQLNTLQTKTTNISYSGGLTTITNDLDVGDDLSANNCSFADVGISNSLTVTNSSNLNDVECSGAITAQAEIYTRTDGYDYNTAPMNSIGQCQSYSYSATLVDDADTSFTGTNMAMTSATDILAGIYDMNILWRISQGTGTFNTNNALVCWVYSNNTSNCSIMLDGNASTNQRYFSYFGGSTPSDPRCYGGNKVIVKTAGGTTDLRFVYRANVSTVGTMTLVCTCILTRIA